jgi:DNA-binding HxlR family transcriptional regulator
MFMAEKSFCFECADPLPCRLRKKVRKLYWTTSQAGKMTAITLQFLDCRPPHSCARVKSSGGKTEVVMDQTGYGQFCPVAMAAEIVCTRWTALILRELLCGNHRFNDLRKGVPRISPTLLSKRLKELEDARIIRQVKDPKTGIGEYHLTEAGEDLRSIIMSFGIWGQRWIDSNLSLRNLDPTLLMWDMRRGINPQPLPKRRVTIRFDFPELNDSRRNWWLVVEPSGDNDLCQVDPGYDVDLFVTSSLRSLTSVWMGLSGLAAEREAGRIEIEGDRAIARDMQLWLRLSPFAKEPRRQEGLVGHAT